METLFQKILDLLILPPGNLIYHLVLAFAILSSLQAAWIGRQVGSYRHMNRLVFGLTMLLLGQVVLFLSSGLAWQGILDQRLFLPPLDRAIVLFSLVWIVWLWNFPTPARLGDLVTGFFNLGVVLLFLFTYTSWRNMGGENLIFNGFWLDWTWELAGLFIVLTGMVILLFTRPAGWGFGLGMLGLSMAGLIAHLVLPITGNDFSGYIRLSQLAAFPMLTMLLHRYSATPVEIAAASAQLVPASAVTPSEPPRTRERRRYSTDPRTLHAWLDLVNEEDPEKILFGTAKAIAHSMLSDLCFIVNGPNYGHIVLQSGYDLVREEEIKGTMLEQGQLPMLSGALQRGKALRISMTDSQPPDGIALSSALGFKDAGSLMFVPLTLNEKPQGGLLFLSPYSNRQWSLEDQGFLSSEVEDIARLIQRANIQGQPQFQAQQLGENLRHEMENLRRENQNLLGELSLLRQGTQRVGGSATVPADKDLNGLVALQQEAQEQIAGLQAENERLLSALKQDGISVLSPQEFERMESELRATLQEVAVLQNQLAQANAHNMMLEQEIRQTGGSVGGNEDHEVITSVVQEIRQPMSSIVGYTDLLLAESVGILGALQRKFLERIRASTERMRTMLDDLIRVTMMGEGPIEILPQPVEFGTIIDGAVADSSAQLREKNIALRVDLPQEMPQINADRDAIQQIVLHLLQNAGAATPPEGTVLLRARMQEDSGSNYLLMQVTDSGGGVQADDLPLVFARRYRADLPLIQGLGDTGVGLSIAKALVDAHGGRIWVESTDGEGTTISVLLPTYPMNPNHTPDE